MTHEEAIKQLTDVVIYHQGECTREALDMAIEALEKLEPKKPKRYIAFDGIERNGCPACPKNEILYAGQKFCSVCGQAIDWEVANETD